MSTANWAPLLVVVERHFRKDIQAQSWMFKLEHLKKSKYVPVQKQFHKHGDARYGRLRGHPQDSMSEPGRLGVA